jgi:phosphoribosyl-AMP cyclohydrolase
MADGDFITRWADRLAGTIRGAVGVFLKGSCARGTPGAHSDVDFDVLVADGRDDEFPAWLDETGDRLVHVSVAVRSAAAWLAEENESQRWALGFPSAEATRLLWVRDDAWRDRLDRRYLGHPAGEPELEDFVADLGKAANALASDDLAVRLAARSVAALRPGVLLPMNESVVVGTAYEALTRALALRVVPPGYREDMLVCLGLSGGATTTEDVYAAARRLVTGTIALCQTHHSAYADLLPGGLAADLADGTLARYVAQFP